MSKGLTVVITKGRTFWRAEKVHWKEFQGTMDQLYIDKIVVREVKSTKKKNIVVGWIDYKKDNNMVPHSWILEFLRLFGATQNIRSLLENAMKSWQTEMTSNGQSLGNNSINRVIFSSETSSPPPLCNHKDPSHFHS